MGPVAVMQAGLSTGTRDFSRNWVWDRAHDWKTGPARAFRSKHVAAADGSIHKAV